MGLTVLMVAGGLGLLVVLALGWVVAAYNRLVRLRNQVEASWAQIDVQLKRRHSLIPNLVESVQGYAAHERTTLQNVVAARQAAVHAAAAGPARQAAAEDVLSRALSRLFAVCEAYPALKADRNFAALQEEQINTEDRIAYARQFYNSAVQTFNAAVQTFPGTVVAGFAGFRRLGYFEADGDERADVDVRF